MRNKALAFRVTARIGGAVRCGERAFVSARSPERALNPCQDRLEGTADRPLIPLWHGWGMAQSADS
jgi:hypothetical protein